jgi:peptidoglycan/LPS O-acetylase OafA/YrhL
MTYAKPNDPPTEEMVTLLEDLDSENGQRIVRDRSPSSHHHHTRSHSSPNAGGSLLSFASAASPLLRGSPLRMASRLAFFLVPSFLQGPHAREQIRPAKIHPTAYLDGMRGLAALFVFFCHYTYSSFVIAEGYGYEDRNWNLLKLPFIRLLYSGPVAVCVFFVISGYALSYKPLKLIRAGNFAELHTTMSSLIFRRGMRLFLPTATSMLLIVFLLQIGAYDWTRDFSHDKHYLKIVMEPHPPALNGIFRELGKWASDCFAFVHVYSWTHFHVDYDVHLWTIPVEFRCSLYLFLAIIGTSRLRVGWRWITMGLVILFTIGKARFDMLLFFFGMMIAELDHMRNASIAQANNGSPLPSTEKAGPTSSWERRMPWIWIVMSIVALYLMGYPDGKGTLAPGWIWLSKLIPSWWSDVNTRWYQSIGSVMFVIAVGRSPGWQAFFNSFPVQYFGKISYAIYLMHGPAMHVVGYHFEKWAWDLTGVDGLQYNLGWALHAMFVIPTVVWWADVFWRAVDIPTVKFAKWVENQVIVKT